MRSWFARGWESRASDLVLIPSGSAPPHASCNNEADEAAIGASVAHSPPQGYFKFLCTETCSQKRLPLCAHQAAAGARVDGEHLRGNSLGCAPRVHTQLQMTATHRGVTSRTKQRVRDASRLDEQSKAARAQEGVALSVTQAFQFFGYRIMFLKRWPLFVHQNANTPTPIKQARNHATMIRFWILKS